MVKTDQIDARQSAIVLGKKQISENPSEIITNNSILDMVVDAECLHHLYSYR